MNDFFNRHRRSIDPPTDSAAAHENFSTERRAEWSGRLFAKVL